jgi:rod shape-determining protein MreC
LAVFFKHRVKWISYIFIILSLILLSLSIGKGREWNPVEKLVIEAIAPFQKIFIETISATKDIWKTYFFLVETRQENYRLKKKIRLLETENSRYQELSLSNQRLQQLLRFQEKITEPILAARVIGWDSSALFKSIIIDRGENDGLKINMPVVNSKGVVGRTVSVSPNYAQVLLILDQNSAVDGLVQRSRCRGMLKGRGLNQCYFDYAVKTCDIKRGDTIVTSGLGSAFPKGLSLGTVNNINNSPNNLFNDIIVDLAVDFSKLEEVLVILRSGFVPGAGLDD